MGHKKNVVPSRGSGKRRALLVRGEKREEEEEDDDDEHFCSWEWWQRQQRRTRRALASSFSASSTPSSMCSSSGRRRRRIERKRERERCAVFARCIGESDRGIVRGSVLYFSVSNCSCFGGISGDGIVSDGRIHCNNRWKKSV